MKENSKEYRAWSDMRNRCNCLTHKDYPNYGERGIKVSPEFDEFVDFLAHVGRAPGPEYSLDRIDNDGNYEPGNVRWATKAEQSQNQSNTKLCWDDVAEIRAMGPYFTNKTIALEFGISEMMVSLILRNKRWIE